MPSTKLAAAHEASEPVGLREAGNNVYGWYIVAVMTVCYTLSFIDRQILSLLVGPIKAELKISDTQVGLLGGLAFGLFYTLMSLPMGRLIDRYNRRNIIASGVFVWSLMTAACALARGFGGLFLARMGVGIGEATLTPAAVSMITDSFPKSSLSLALSVYSTGIYIGSGLALLVGGLVVQALADTPTLTLPLIGEISSWRATFLIVGLPGILVAAWVMTLREPKRGGVIRRDDGSASTLTVRETVGELRRRWASVTGIACGLMMQAIALYAFMLWAPVVLQRIHGWSPGDTGLVMGLSVLIGGCAGMLTGGALSDRWLRLGRRDGALRVGAYSSAAGAMVFGALLLLGSSANVTAALFALGITLLAMPAGSCFAATQMILPNQVRGQAIALVLFVSNLGGLTLGPLLPGLLNDQLFRSEAALATSLGLTLTCATIGAALVFQAARRSYRRDHAALDE